MHGRVGVYLSIAVTLLSGCAQDRAQKLIRESYDRGVRAANQEILAGSPTIWTYGLNPEPAVDRFKTEVAAGCTPTSEQLAEIRGHNERIRAHYSDKAPTTAKVAVNSTAARLAGHMTPEWECVLWDPGDVPLLADRAGTSSTTKPATTRTSTRATESSR
jgi:hypothetical protein